MLRKLLVVLLLLLAAQVALTVALYQAIGWWALVAVAALNVVAGPLLVKRALKALFMMPFKAKGAVLRGASAVVHSVEPAAAPVREEGDEDDEDDEEEPEGARDYFYVDVTVAPRPAEGPFSHWEPGELVLVRPGAKAIPDDEDDGEVGSVGEVLVWDGESFAEDDPGKYQGEQRLRLHVAVVPGTRRAQFRYYFEIFGDVELPATTSIGAGA